MSIEALIQENTAALKALTAALLAQPKAETPAAEEAKRGPGRPKKAEAEPERKSLQLLPGDPEGTRYFHIEKNKTVARILPGETVPDVCNGHEVDGSVYSKYKGIYQPTIVSAVEPTFQELTTQVTRLSKIDGGREKIKAILTKYGVEKFPALAALNKNTAIMADIMDALTPPKVEAPVEDDLGI